MSRSGSRQSLALGVLLAWAGLFIFAGVFYVTQNGSDRIGGPISPQKLLWLVYAIALWLILPVAIVFDERVAEPLRNAFAALAALMLARGAIELWMLYVSHNWSPWYGIAHDLACMAVLAAFGAHAWRMQVWRAAPNALLLFHLTATTAAFIPEIYFAHYMTQNFNTAGDAAVYFVPAEERYRDVLQVTTGVVAALSVYLPVFCWGWLVGTPGSKHTHAS